LIYETIADENLRYVVVFTPPRGVCRKAGISKTGKMNTFHSAHSNETPKNSKENPFFKPSCLLLLSPLSV